MRQHWAHARPWHTNAALVAIGFMIFWFSGQFVRENVAFWIGFSGCSSSMAVLYLAGCFLVLTQPVDRWTFPIVITVACACHLVTIFADPFLSTDVYRYVWDGIVQHAHINPFRYVPGDKALTFLRAPNQDIFDNINRRDYARTIYPPAAQAIFYLITAVSPTVTCMKAFMVLFEGLTAWGLVKILHHLGHRREQVLLFAWCPLLVWEFGGSGHLDSVAMAFIALALLSRLKSRPVLTGLFLGLAVITKMYPLILFPALYRRGDWKMPATLAAVIGIGYAFYSSVGMLVFGFIGGYAKEEGLETGTRYFLLDWAQHLPGLHSLSSPLFLVLCVLVFAAISLWAWRTGCTRDDASFLFPAFGLAIALMLLFSPHYAWYIAWLLPFFCLMPSLPMATYLMGFFYGYTTWLADPGPRMFLLNERLYAVTFLALLIHLALKRWTPYTLAPQSARSLNQLSPEPTL